MSPIRSTLGWAGAWVLVAALAGCADEGSIVTLELESIEARACDCGPASSMAIDAFFQVDNAGTEPGTVEPLEIALFDASTGMLLIRYEEVAAVVVTEDPGLPPRWDGVVPPETTLRVQMGVRASAVPGGLDRLVAVATVSVRVNGVARSYASDGPIRLTYQTM